MALKKFVQENNPIPRTGCGRRRMEQMTPFAKISGPCKAAAKCTKAGGPSKFGGGKKKK